MIFAPAVSIKRGARRIKRTFGFIPIISHHFMCLSLPCSSRTLNPGTRNPILPLLLMLAALNLAHAQDSLQLGRKGLILGGLSLVPSTGGGSFMKDYAMLGTGRQSLPLVVAPAASVHVPLNGAMRLTLFSSYMSTTVLDNYFVYDTTGGTLRQSPGIIDELSTSAIPVMAGIDMVSGPAQFGSYIGVEAGIAVTTVNWTTRTQGAPSFDFFRPAINTSGTSIAPALRVAAGVTYDFDATRSSQTVIRGIYLEGSYLTIPVHRDYFATLRQQGRGGTLPAEDDATLDLGGAGLTLGLMINLAGR